MRFPISAFNNIGHILYRFQDIATKTPHYPPLCHSKASLDWSLRNTVSNDKIPESLHLENCMLLRSAVSTLITQTPKIADFKI